MAASELLGPPRQRRVRARPGNTDARQDSILVPVLRRRENLRLPLFIARHHHRELARRRTQLLLAHHGFPAERAERSAAAAAGPARRLGLATVRRSLRAAT